MSDFDYESLRKTGEGSAKLNDCVSVTVKRDSDAYLMTVCTNTDVDAVLNISRDYLFNFKVFSRGEVVFEGTDYTLHGKLRLSSDLIDKLDSFAHSLQVMY